MAFQGFIDDSGEGDAPGDPVFVLGGFISSAERWASFSKEWRGALDDTPSIDYFKMAEAANFSANGQFARRLGWTEAKRDAKLELLTGVIVRHVELKVNCSVDKAAFANTPSASPSLTTRRFSTSLTPSLFSTSSSPRRRYSSPMRFPSPAPSSSMSKGKSVRTP